MPYPSGTPGRFRPYAGSAGRGRSISEFMDWPAVTKYWYMVVVSYPTHQCVTPRSFPSHVRSRGVRAEQVEATLAKHSIVGIQLRSKNRGLLRIPCSAARRPGQAAQSTRFSAGCLSTVCRINQCTSSDCVCIDTEDAPIRRLVLITFVSASTTCLSNC